ncbi:hypothetical protein D9619_009117 [Psilocybe cf. subviscida]|uniref:Uncharacterized protein n=1 Tax=Psilocybe cf. subviscida TaxID=2480587 RepID=A0A8H5FAH2_9AGAR|nr:hypothetical protein D9619_009117 [Psilocybe cf. subviscida]
MSAPSSSPPRRTPLGPYFNRLGESSISKPAPGKENIRPWPASSAITIRAIATATQTPSTTTTTETISPEYALSIDSDTAATADTQTGSTTAATIQTNKPSGPASTALPISLPPWRLPGAFDTDDDGEEKANATGTNKEKDADVTNSAIPSEGGHCNDEEAAVITSPEGVVTPSTQTVDKNEDEAKESEGEFAIDSLAHETTAIYVSFVRTDLDEDPELDYGDEFHDLPQ